MLQVCVGFVLLSPTYTSIVPGLQGSASAPSGSGVKTEGKILCTGDPVGLFRFVKEKKEEGDEEDEEDEEDEGEGDGDGDGEGEGEEEENEKETEEKEDTGKKVAKTKTKTKTKTKKKRKQIFTMKEIPLPLQLSFKHATIHKSKRTFGGGDRAKTDEPKRGDYICFTKGSSSSVKNVKVLEKSTAEVVKGKVEKMGEAKGEMNIDGGSNVLEFDFDSVVSCEAKVLKVSEERRTRSEHGKRSGTFTTAAASLFKLFFSLLS